MCNELSTIICNESSNKCIYRIQTTKKLETSYRLRSLITVHIPLIVILSWRWWRCWMIQQMMRWFNDGTCEMLLFKMAESIQAGLNKTDGKWQNEDEVDTACRLRNPYVLTAFAPVLQKLVATSPKQTKKTKLRQFPWNGEQKPSNSITSEKKQLRRVDLKNSNHERINMPTKKYTKTRKDGSLLRHSRAIPSAESRLLTRNHTKCDVWPQNTQQKQLILAPNKKTHSHM